MIDQRNDAFKRIEDLSNLLKDVGPSISLSDRSEETLNGNLLHFLQLFSNQQITNHQHQDLNSMLNMFNNPDFTEEVLNDDLAPEVSCSGTGIELVRNPADELSGLDSGEWLERLVEQYLLNDYSASDAQSGSVNSSSGKVVNGVDGKGPVVGSSSIQVKEDQGMNQNFSDLLPACEVVVTCSDDVLQGGSSLLTSPVSNLKDEHTGEWLQMSHSIQNDVRRTSLGFRRKRLSTSMTVTSDSDDMSDESDDEYDDEGCSERVVTDDQQKYAEDFLTLGCKLKPYFWQYNAQNRGPKGRRLQAAIELRDPHVLDDFVDPVTQTTHGGADPRASPEKLLDIGRRIQKLDDEFKSVSANQCAASRVEVNRQKNKLASRICRLKRKAQHEANKIKLNGLREEHRQLQMVIINIVNMLTIYTSTLQNTPNASTPAAQGQQTAAPSSRPTKVVSCPSAGQLSSTSEMKQGQLQPLSVMKSEQITYPSLTSYVTSLIRQNLKYMIAGNTSDYVNSELKKVANEHLQAQI